MSEINFRLFKNRITGRISKRTISLWFVLVLGLSATFMINIMLGSYDLTISEIVKILIDPQFKHIDSTVVWQLRMPRFLTAAMVGAMLALSGSLLQAITHNPLADPSLVGVSQGASLAVVALIVLFPNTPIEFRALAAFIGASAIATLIQWISYGKHSLASLRFILIGIGVAATISAGTTAMLTYGHINNSIAALSWISGGVHTATWVTCLVLFIGLLIILPVLVWSAYSVAPLRFSPEISIGIGSRHALHRLFIIMIAVALAALAVSVAGPIGFIGLIAPQITHKINSARPGSSMLLTALIGALMLCIADILGRTMLSPIQIPAGLVATLIGAPAFIFLLIRQHQKQKISL